MGYKGNSEAGSRAGFERLVVELRLLVTLLLSSDGSAFQNLFDATNLVSGSADDYCLNMRSIFLLEGRVNLTKVARRN
jgi:hypothetical protein